MFVQRAFYVTQGALVAWSRDTKTPSGVVSFSDNDEGLRQFDAYLAANSEQTSLVLIDVIEEEFAIESMPKLGFRDRKALLQRRLQRKFPRTPYRIPVYLGAAERGSQESVVVHSAITNHELLDPWLQTILRYQTPLAGVYSVPMLAPKLLARFYKSEHPVLFLTQHQGTKLRQAFLHSGSTRSARLSQSPSPEDPEYAKFVVSEIHRSRRYLERSRLLSSMEQLDVCMVADKYIADSVLENAESQSPLQFHFVSPKSAARSLGMESTPAPDRLEALYLSAAVTQRPRFNYATSGENQYWLLRRLRHAIIGTSVAASIIFSILSGWFLSDAFSLKQRNSEIEEQVAQLSETFRRENNRVNPIRADSHEMKLAVDTGDYILANRLPVPWVMQQLGFVMGDYPDVQILDLSWQAEAEATDQAPPRRSAVKTPVPIPAITTVSAEFSAELRPFDGNLRDAFARIDALVADVAFRTAFSQVQVVEYPLDASPSSALSGEIATGKPQGAARFRLRLTFTVPTAVAGTGGSDDESV